MTHTCLKEQHDFKYKTTVAINDVIKTSIFRLDVTVGTTAWTVDLLAKGALLVPLTVEPDTDVIIQSKVTTTIMIMKKTVNLPKFILL